MALKCVTNLMNDVESDIETIEILTLAFKRHQGHNQFNMFQRSRLRTNVKMLANL